MNRTAEAATTKIYALTGRIITGKSYDAVASKYYALTGRIL
jgi:hypothetical protein